MTGWSEVFCQSLCRSRDLSQISTPESPPHRRVVGTGQGLCQGPEQGLGRTCPAEGTCLAEEPRARRHRGPGARGSGRHRAWAPREQPRGGI